MWTIIHRIQTTADDGYRSRRRRSPDELDSTDKHLISLYLDPPHVLYHNDFYDDKEPSVTLRGDMPIPNLNIYLSRHPEIVLVVFKNYDTDTMISGMYDALGEYDDNISPAQKVVPTSESLMVVSGTTWRGIRSIFLKLSDDSKQQGKIKLLRELEAPYLYVFHHRDALNGFAKKLTGATRSTWALLLYYIDASYGTEHRNVRKMIRDARVTRRYIQYLFKPGDVVLSDVDTNPAAYEIMTEVEATRQGRNSSSDSNSRDSEYSVDETPADGGDDSSITFSGNRTSIVIETRHWEFDGLFKKSRKTLYLHLNGPLDREIPIKSLDIFPIKFAEPGVIDRIKHRGLELWKSRGCRYVSYKVQWDSKEIRNVSN